MKQARAFLITALLILASSPVLAQEEAAHEGGGLPQFDPAWWPSQVFWLAVCFVILYVAMAKKIIPDIGGVLDTRRAKIESALAAAERARAEAQQAQEAYEKLMADARAEASRLMADAVAQVKAEAEKRTQTLQKKAEHDTAALEKRLDAAKKQAKQDMHGMVAEIASAAAEKIVGIAPDLNRAKTVVQSLKGTEAA